MEPGIARSIASRHHAGQRDRFGFGDSVIDHVERVAAAASPDARAMTLLQDLFERCPTVGRPLRGKGLTGTELEALELLRHAPGGPYEGYVAGSRTRQDQPDGSARTVKLADLEDHLAHPSIPAYAPLYAWAHKQLLTARDRPVQATLDGHLGAGRVQPPRPLRLGQGRLVVGSGRPDRGDRMIDAGSGAREVPRSGGG